MPTEPTESRSVGRPRTIPKGAKRYLSFFTDAEITEIDRAAEISGLSRLQWMRRELIRAAAKTLKKQAQKNVAKNS